MVVRRMLFRMPGDVEVGEPDLPEVPQDIVPAAEQDEVPQAFPMMPERRSLGDDLLLSFVREQSLARRDGSCA